MIGRIRGTVSEIDGTIGLIETASGIYYQVYLTSNLLSKHQVSNPIDVYTYLQIREDAHVLFGFETKQEHKLFLLLLSVPGIGPRSAFTVISYTKNEELIAAVKKNDVQFFTNIKGLGKKTALKIILELSQKFKTEFTFQDQEVSEDDKTVIEALTSLGFGNKEIRKTISNLPKDMRIEDEITKAIQILSGNKHT